MDLISRKDAVSRISDLLILELKSQRIPTWNEVYHAIGDIPSVPAVPLDKLCDVLSSRSLDIFTAEHCCLMSEEFWKSKIIEWMEGLDDHG